MPSFTKSVFNSTSSLPASPALSSTVLMAYFYPLLHAKGVPFCIDTGADASCISESYLQSYFPHLELHPHTAVVSGVGPIPITAISCVSAKIPLQDKKRTAFSNDVTLLVLKSLPAGLLLGTDACLANTYQISFPKSTILSNDHEFTATSVHANSLKLPTSLKKQAIYSTVSCTVHPAQGFNLPVTHQYQLSHANAFLVT